jgi:UDP-3-O-[3-hydroxymyristoyl] glucosamine N-acyltransferase
MVGISGSCTLGDGVVMAGASGLVDHIEVGDGAIIGGRSMATHNVPAGQHVFGCPATEKNEAFRTISLTRRLPKLQAQLKQLLSRMETLEDTP